MMRAGTLKIQERFFASSHSVCSHTVRATPYETSFRRRFFAYHKDMRHPHTNIILSLYSIPLILIYVPQKF